MSDTEAPLTFDDIIERHVGPIVDRTRRRYGVDREDIRQELLLWMYGDGRERVERWLDANPQQLVRLFYALTGVAHNYASAERAARFGYSPADQYYYTAETIEDLLPYALDDSFDGVVQAEDDGTGGRANTPLNERGDYLAQVMDVRRALQAAPTWVKTLTPTGVAWIVEYLGGDRPAVGSRRRMSNAAAQAATGREWDGS